MSKRELSALSSDLGGYWASTDASTTEAAKSKPASKTKSAQTTQFYAGDRIAIDDSFLKKYEGEDMSIPYASGEPGTPEFRIRFHSSGKSVSLDDLHGVRRSWDTHLSTISSPSARLRACIEVMKEEYIKAVPVLFPGEGTLADVIRFHVAVDKSSIAGPHSRPGRTFLPETLLGDYVDQYLRSVLGEEEEHNMFRYTETDNLKRIVRELILVGGKDAALPFFQPLDRGYMASLSYFRSNGGTWAGMVRGGLKYKPGQTAVENMTAFNDWYLGEWEVRVDRLDLLISDLSKAKRGGFAN